MKKIIKEIRNEFKLAPGLYIALIIMVITFILMGVFSMDILGRSIADIQRRMVDQTDYRINVVKGVVATVNINGTFGCYIAGETVIYPNIPTFSRDPKLQVGDKVTIEFINGCRGTPAILAPEDIRERPDTTEPVSALIFVVYDNGATFYINGYDTNGNLALTFNIIETENIGNALAVDSNSNVYVLRDTQLRIYKYDSGGTYIMYKSFADYVYDIAIGPDGFLYTLGKARDGSEDYIIKRDLATLNYVDHIVIDPLGNGIAYYGFTIDSDGDFYFIKDEWGGTEKYERWDWVAGLVASQVTTHYTFASLATVGATLANVHWLAHAITLPKNLGGAETDKELIDIGMPAALGSIGSDFLVSGYSDLNEFSIGKYNSVLTKIWTIKIGAIAEFNYGSIGAYPF